MAQQEPDSMIGYDPLAWMAEAFDDSAEHEEHEEKADDTLAAVAMPTAVAEMEKQNAGGRIVLESTLNIQSVATLHAHLLQLIDHEQDIVLDASQVEQIDTTNLQLLLALKQETVTLQKNLVIEAPSERFIKACYLLGLDGMLNLV